MHSNWATTSARERIGGERGHVLRIEIPPVHPTENPNMAFPNLLLYSDDDKIRPFAPVVGGIWNIGPKEQKTFKSLDDMAREIGRQQFLGQLVIFTHGVPGQILLADGHGYGLADAAVAK